MRTAQLAIGSTPFKDGKTHRAGNWSAFDHIELDPDCDKGPWAFRDVYHYRTLMGTFKRYLWADPGTAWGDWSFEPVSLGWGSVSDAQGMNQVARGFGWVMRRDARGGGPRWVRWDS